MYIWLDSKSIPRFIEENLAISQKIRTDSFQQSISLHRQSCSDGTWFVCDPIGTGQVVVLDTQLFGLLEHLRQPKTLLELAQDAQGCSPSTIERAIELFHKSGLIQNVRYTPLIPPQAHPQILSAWLHVTNACNLRCDYCYLEKTNEHITDDIARRAVDAIFRSAAKHRFTTVILKYAGGEASLHLNRVMAIHDYAVQLSRQYSIKLQSYIMSNGVFLPQQAIDQIQARHIGVAISLDGIDTHHNAQRSFINGHGSFKYVERSIHLLLANGIVPHISVTVSQRNLQGLPRLIEYILEREMPFHLSYYRDVEYPTQPHDLQFRDEQLIATMREVFQIIEQRLPPWCLLGSLIDKANLNTSHHHTCGVGRNYLVVDQQGGIAKCHADMRQTITTVDADDPLQAIKEDISGIQGLPVEEKEACRTCEWRYWCSGGCPLLTYRTTGRYDIKSPYCDIYKALFPGALRLEALRLLKYTQPIVL